MLDKREAQDKPLIILCNSKDYPTWKPYTISRLQQQNCNWAIVGRPKLNLESVRANLIEDGFAAEDLRPSMLAAALRNEKKGLPCCPNEERRHYPGARRQKLSLLTPQ